MRPISARHAKSEKGNALAIFGFAIASVMVVFGLVVQAVAPRNAFYTSPQSLQEAAEAAAVAASAEFKRNYTIPTMQAAAQAVFDSYTIQPESLTVETCDTIVDPLLCTDPPRKLVRVTVTAPVEPDGTLMTVEATAEAPSLDVVLVIDSSESMAWYDENDVKYTGDMTYKRDPKACNDADPGAADGYKGSCFPFQKVKAAAINFIDLLYFPYDRAAIVSFNQNATVDSALSENQNSLEDAVQNLRVYQGQGPCLYEYSFPDSGVNFEDRSAQSPVPPLPYTSASQITKACRLYNAINNAFYGFECPLAFGPNPRTDVCGNTNPGAAFTAAGNALAGFYPPTPPIGIPGTRCVADGDCPAVREHARRVVIFLSDGAANSALDNQGNPICPAYTQTWQWLNNGNVGCRDSDSFARHDSNSSLYDPDDYARDMIDLVAANNDLIYTIAMPGSELMGSAWSGDPPAQALLQYAAALGLGNYYAPATSSQLDAIFLAIFNTISTVSTPIVFPTPIPTNTTIPTITRTPTITSIPSITPTPTLTKTKTLTRTPTMTPSKTITPTPTLTGSATFTSTVITVTATITETETPIPTTTSAPTETITPTQTGSVTPTPTFTPTRTQTATPTQTPTPTSTATPATQTFTSVAAHDGWLLESSENSNRGGALNAFGATLRVGDDAYDRQYRSIVSFNTANLPSNAVLVSATLRLKQQGGAGTYPFITHKSLLASIRKPFFGSRAALEAHDFQAAAMLETAGIVSAMPVGSYYFANLENAALAYINRTGLTQLRLGFVLGDNNDLGADFLSFHSGNATNPAFRPVLQIKYYIPPATPTITPTSTKTSTPTITPTNTETSTLTITPTNTETSTLTFTPTSTETSTPTITPTATPRPPSATPRCFDC